MRAKSRGHGQAVCGTTAVAIIVAVAVEILKDPLRAFTFCPCP